MTCPKCGGDVYDNRADKASGEKSAKWPDFKCKDKTCDWAQWPEKPKQTKAQVQAFTPAQQRIVDAAAAEAPRVGDRHAYLTALYWQCFDEILAGLKTRAISSGFPAAEISAMTSTLFIARSKV